MAYRHRLLLCTSDIIAAISNGDLVLALFTTWHTIVGYLPGGTTITLMYEDGQGAEAEDLCQVTWDKVHRDAVVVCVKDDMWSLSYGTTRAEAKIRAQQRLEDTRQFHHYCLTTAKQLLSHHYDLPTLKSAEKDRLLNKCLSVMKVNTLSAEGANAVNWSTPDRVPHQHMWLWDSVFHSFGMNHIDPEIAWHFLEAVFERQKEDGMIPHMMRVNGSSSQITQPPILAWGVWKNYEIRQNKTALMYAFPRLERYLDWNLTHRDENHNGLLEWHIEAHPLSRSGESGMDNSQRFDEAIQLDAVDFSTFQALDMIYTAQIAEVLEFYDRALHWRRRANHTSTQIHQLLWDTQNGFYYDRSLDSKFTSIKAVSGFLPLLLEDIPDDYVKCLVQHLHNPETFGTAFPIPSVAIDTPGWSTDMWRGATWINMNYMVIQGLERHGYHKTAQNIKEKTLHYVTKYYYAYGVLFEFYDAKDIVPPVACDRKGRHCSPYDIRVKMDSIRDYHWTAALVADMLLQKGIY